MEVYLDELDPEQNKYISNQVLSHTTYENHQLERQRSSCRS